MPESSVPEQSDSVVLSLLQYPLCSRIQVRCIQLPVVPHIGLIKNHFILIPTRAEIGFTHLSVSLKQAIILFCYISEWDLKDAAGNPILFARGAAASPRVIDPGESAWYCIYVDNVTGVSHMTTRLMAEPSINYQYDIVHYPVSNVRLVEEDGLPVAYGTIENNSDIVLNINSNSLPYIYVFLYDQDGFLLGKLGLNTFLDLAPGEKGDFKAEFVLHPSSSGKKATVDFSSIANYETIAYQLFERS